MKKDGTNPKVEDVINNMRVDFSLQIEIAQRVQVESLQTNEDMSKCKRVFVNSYPLNLIVIIVG